jgi:hypothetical protein
MSDLKSIDLGREDELVPWSEWFRRTSETVEHILNEALEGEGPEPDSTSESPRWIFRVTLVDGRTFAVTRVSTHISRGRCFVGENRWDMSASQQEIRKSAGKVASVINASRPICDVITGYTLMGTGEDGFPTVLNIPPAMIASVEGVVLPRRVSQSDASDNGKDSPEPFGFARWAAQQDKDRPEIFEVEDSGFPEGAD